ncbi:hypothetical protein SAMN05444279_1302 [Ruegeria intermedia]|uniref:Uncharacterized protein n=1 Tax=Ruegeria intermedia TaxID=996115 RepID=A0A1M5AYX0_9RHOB|nr:hypothetical protein SAMN05444279_1302 [Ruegeria intermedia]
MKFILATDGITLEAEYLVSDVAPIACESKEFPDHFGFFLPLAGIFTVKQIRESSFDIKATGRLNRLYVELLKDNPDWGTAERRHDMNHFMARLIFCFFAEDTDIFVKEDQFTATVEQMSEKDSSNTHEVISELFRAMNTKAADREKAGIPRGANAFPFVNGGLFSGRTEVPRFSKIARSYLLTSDTSRQSVRASGPASELSFDDVPKHFPVEGQTGDDPLQPSILIFQFAQPLHL